jgi:hypothetical protein
LGGISVNDSRQGEGSIPRDEVGTEDIKLPQSPSLSTLGKQLLKTKGSAFETSFSAVLRYPFPSFRSKMKLSLLFAVALATFTAASPVAEPEVDLQKRESPPIELSGDY